MEKQKGDIVERAIKAAWVEMEKHDPQQFQKLKERRSKKEGLNKAAREAAAEQIKLAPELAGTEEPQDIAERLMKHLSKDRVEMIKTGLQVPTYQLGISSKPDGTYTVDITRHGKEFMESLQLDTLASIEKVSGIQIASIIVEVLLFAIQVVGIKVAVSDQMISNTAKEIMQMISRSAMLMRAINELRKVACGLAPKPIAKAIFNLIDKCYKEGILWKILKSLCSNMSAWDWIITAVTVTAMIVAALATDGLALVAKIILALVSAYNFLQKLMKLDELDEHKKKIK